MPREVFGPNYAFLPRADILSFEEIARIASICCTLGVEKVRLTGGEPLLRRDLPRLIEMLGRVAGISDIALTTNGSLLAKSATDLRLAGLHRLTVSVDALNEEIFTAMNGTDLPLRLVLDGIDAALSAGFSPIKINAVIKRGVNEDQIGALAKRFAGSAFILRFIEYMDVGNTNGWQLDDLTPAREIAERMAEFTPLEPMPANYSGEVAKRYRRGDGGEAGIVSSVSQPFCRQCTRARLSADGRLFTCLFAGDGHDLRGPLRAGASDADLRALIERIWTRRDDRYSELRFDAPKQARKAEMSLLGG